MTVLHTSDWHLGQKFLFRDREDEHQAALDWLHQLIAGEGVDVLIVAGDIFDIGNPPNYARRMYYNFITNLRKTTCRHVVIVGGNHDSPAMLEAPRDLLQSMQVHVVGSGRTEPEEEVIVLYDAQGEPEAIVAAVPFLRDRDLRTSVAGETGSQRIGKIREGIKAHYEAVGAVCEHYRDLDVPILATGHLYAQGAAASDKQDNIYIGDKENIQVGDFPEVFDYVALGHIHRQQAIGGQEHVRYCGSLIPLSFSETKDDKGVLLLTFDGKKLAEITVKQLPVFRRLKTIQGTLADVEEALQRFAAKGDRGLTPWVEVLVEREGAPARLDLHLQKLVEEADLELLKIRLVGSQKEAWDTDQEVVDLEDLDIEEVFRRRCESMGLEGKETDELVHTFKELVDWQRTESEEA
jgi:DNA repair protein SbcD/Mre11